MITVINHLVKTSAAAAIFLIASVVVGQNNNEDVERFIEQRTGFVAPPNLLELAQVQNRQAELS